MSKPRDQHIHIHIHTHTHTSTHIPTHTHTGDGIVPLPSAHLHGDKVVRLTLDGAYHSINDAGQMAPCDRWYGAEGVVDKWLPAVVEKIHNQRGG